MALKRYRRGTHRAVPPAETVALARPHLERLGVTRIANVTGLDRIGLPVVMVTRPNSRAVAVAQGKGLDLDAAIASGVMEAVEAWHAENLALPVIQASYEELRGRQPTVDPDLLPRPRGGGFDARLPMPWVEGRNLLKGGAPCLLPRRLVHADFTLPAPPEAGCFCASSNGLAAGNHADEALVHALSEVIERDATAVWRARGRADREATRVDLESIADVDCLEVLDRLDAADLAVGIWETTSDIGVAAYRVEICERGERLPLFFAPPAAGAGCHPARAVALLRALTEACQSRLTLISGARDDLGCASLDPSPAWLEAKRRQLISSPAEARPFGQGPDFDGQHFAADLAFLLARLQAAQVDQVVMVDLSRPEGLGLPAVRVVVPGLETNPEHPRYVPGRRARAAASWTICTASEPML
jgi:ribosomal protein S12 methylthiotransferase accessory factor